MNTVLTHEPWTLLQTGAAGGRGGLADIQEDEDDGAFPSYPVVPGPLAYTARVANATHM